MAELKWLEGGKDIADSSNIRSIAIDELTGAIYVNFHNGLGYKYSGVDKDVAKRDFTDFRQAESLGKFLNSRIKPFYDYERL